MLFACCVECLGSETRHDECVSQRGLGWRSDLATAKAGSVQGHVKNAGCNKVLLDVSSPQTVWRQHFDMMDKSCDMSTKQVAVRQRA